MKPSTHARLLDAGWSYRTNANRGWVIYRDPTTGLWHAQDEAIRILEAADADPARRTSLIFLANGGLANETTTSTSLTTSERYLGVHQDFARRPVRLHQVGPVGLGIRLVPILRRRG